MKKVLMMFLPLLLISQLLMVPTYAMPQAAVQGAHNGVVQALATSSTNATVVKPTAPPFLRGIMGKLLSLFIYIALFIAIIFLIRAVLMYIQRPEMGLSSIWPPLIGVILILSFTSIINWLFGVNLFVP